MQIMQDPWILQVVSGYQLPFSHKPSLHPMPQRSSHLSSEEQEKVHSAIRELVHKLAIQGVNAHSLLL